MDRLGGRRRPSTNQLLYGTLIVSALVWASFLYLFFAPVVRESSAIKSALRAIADASDDFDLDNQPAFSSDHRGMHVIAQFPVLDQSLDQEVDKHDRLLRQLEYTEALIENLIHPAVECVHIMLERAEDEAFIMQQILAYPYASRFAGFIPKEEDGGADHAQRLWRYVNQSDRVRFVQLGRWMLYADAFGYARRELPGRLCVIQNGDISLSLARQHVQAYRRLVSSAVTGSDKQSLLVSAHGHSKVFILSRSHLELPSCPTTVVRNCAKAALIGSYDTYIFISPLPEILEWQTPMPQNIWGAENRVIWALKCLNISVTNPCLELVTVHHHCKSSFRPTQQEDPIGLPRVEYDKNGPYSFPPRKPAASLEESMDPADFPAREICHHFPWNGPEGRSAEDIAAQRRDEANANQAKARRTGGWKG